MPHDDFEAAVMSALGSLQAGQANLGDQITTIFHRLEGNGQPGISQRLAVLETRCAARIQAQKDAAEADQAAREQAQAAHAHREGHYNTRLGIYLTIATIAASFLVVGLDKLIDKVFK